VARIKIATDFRDGIDEPLVITALGVLYTLCIVDEKDILHSLYGGERFKYEGFIDFDSNTASRVKLDVARIKIATDFRDGIDEPLVITTLGVLYTLCIVEEKGIVHSLYGGERFDEEEDSWVESVNIPMEAVEAVSSDKGGSSVEGEEDGGVDLSPDMQHAHRGTTTPGGDVSFILEGKSQDLPFVLVDILQDKNDKEVEEES
jgi:hypothetical protein